MEYTNYKGEKKDLSELDHQHLSNIYWYNKVIFDKNDIYLSIVLDQIRDRFDSKLLPYTPQWQFWQEIEYLDKIGAFVWNESRTEADIVYKFKVIGHYTTPETIRQNKINSIVDEESI